MENDPTQRENHAEAFQKSSLTLHGVLYPLMFLSILRDFCFSCSVLIIIGTSSEDYKAGACITQKGNLASDKKAFPASYSYQVLCYTSVKIITRCGAKDTRGQNQK